MRYLKFFVYFLASFGILVVTWIVLDGSRFESFRSSTASTNRNLKEGFDTSRVRVNVKNRTGVNVKDGFGTRRVQVDLFMALVTAPSRSDRRIAIRQTWLSTLPKYPGIAMRFFTDGKELDNDTKSALLKEKEKFGDLELLPVKNGYWFSHRYLWALFWAFERYDFQFFLRTDDDYFICLNNFNNDLQFRKQEKLLYWGNLGCDPKMVAMDEGFLIVSKDIAQELIKRNESLYCHPMGGQMIAMWINLLEKEHYNVTYFADNSRLIHYRAYLKADKKTANLCSDVIGIHESYPQQMKEYWNLTKDTWFNMSFTKVIRKPYNEYCGQPKGWDWRVLNAFWRHEPKPCWMPGLSWPELDKYTSHKGRE